MLRVTKLTDYATVVLTVLAQGRERVHSAAELAERSRVEPATVAKVLKLLAQAGLVESFRGASGGYRLARPPAQIPLRAIVEAIEGPMGMTTCSVHDGECGIEAHCGIRAGWQRINDVVVDALDRTTLADMLAPAPASGPRHPDPKAIPAALVASD
ncbi:SUF system Fe-S cluster assembly regulator [Silanimonas lenta]|uniref:SUF system Fe-S cluster assembly regulator n=1 Tax=Silanimonas lenta TaxID=265429 RepID=UPI0003F5EC94|nr:SUF system Fe-S cluster assembly regulator [Silanimonas lenta]